MAASLKVVQAGLKESYQSEFTEPYFMLSAAPTGEGEYAVWVSFALPNTMEDVDVAEVDCVMQEAELTALIDELDTLCQKFPDRN